MDNLSILLLGCDEMTHNDNYYFNLTRANIKKERERQGLTQQQLADKAGISMNYLAKIESEKMQRGFSITILGRFIDIQDLFQNKH